MEYITSIENTPYMRWQLGLLRESFRLHGLEDKLVATVAEHPLGKPIEGRVVYHENVGADYACLNRAKGLLEAVQRGEISQPFVSIDPDTVLVHPIEPTDKQVSGHQVHYATYNILQEEGGYDVEELFSIPKDAWPGIGCVYLFQDVPDMLFHSIYTWTEELSKRCRGVWPDKFYWQLDITAYNVAMKKMDLDVDVRQYEAALNPILIPHMTPETNLIHYCNGVAPHFDKRWHNAANSFSLCDPLPFVTILKIPTKGRAIAFFKEVVKSFLRRKPNMEDFLIVD